MEISKEIKILVVDDIDRMRLITNACLSQLGFYNVIMAADGVEALQVLNKEKIDFIVSDWDMPEMNGLDLLKQVRQHPTLSKIPFLMVTAEADRNNIIDAIKAGVSNYIIKPIETQKLAQKMSAIFNEPLPGK